MFLPKMSGKSNNRSTASSQRSLVSSSSAGGGEPKKQSCFTKFTNAAQQKIVGGLEGFFFAYGKAVAK